MKKIFSLLLIFVLVCLCFAGCGKSDTVSSDATTDADTGESIVDAATNVGNNNYIVQPSNAKQELISGMLMCYLDYVVDDAAYLDYVSVAVTPAIIQSPADFAAFFATAEQPDAVAKAEALYAEMTATEEGKDLYHDASFYDSWNLIVISVRESNAQTKHTIDSVSYSNDSCIFYVNGTRDVATGDGDGTVRHYVFRVPKNIYSGVSHSFTKVE